MKNLKIIFDNIIFSLQNAGGISNYWTQLIKQISKNKIFFFENNNNNIFRKKLNINTYKESKFPIQILRYLPFQKKLPSKSIFHSSYLRTTFQKDIVKVVTIFDFTYEYYEIGIRRLIHSWQKKISINNADGIICISNNTKKDLLKFYPKLNKKKIITIYLGVEKSFFQIRNLKKTIKGTEFQKISKKKIILYVGDRKKSYKNFYLSIEVVSSLKDFTLVAVGGNKITIEEQKLINKKIYGRFQHFHNVNNEKLNKLYNLAFCLLYPSLYEGFGLPVIEAMRAGCPVVSTNKSSIKEISNNSALLVNKINKKNFIDAIKLINKKNIRNSLIKKGLKNSKKFRWKNCADQTLKFYKKIYFMKFKKKETFHKNIIN